MAIWVKNTVRHTEVEERLGLAVLLDDGVKSVFPAVSIQRERLNGLRMVHGAGVHNHSLINHC